MARWTANLEEELHITNIRNKLGFYGTLILNTGERISGFIVIGSCGNNLGEGGGPWKFHMNLMVLPDQHADYDDVEHVDALDVADVIRA